MGDEKNAIHTPPVVEDDIDSRSSIQVGDIIHVHATPEQEARVLRKIDWFILPLMGFCYMLQYTDKVSLGYSTQLGLMKDLKLVGTEYSWTSSIFYFGYLGWSWPSSYLAVRFPLGRYLAVSVMLWGMVLMCHGATKSYAGLMTVRFFLGVTESAVAPGFALLTGMFYKRKEQPSRMSIWFIGNGVANTVSGVIAYGIGRANTSLQPWRLLFLVLGAITFAWGIVLLFLLPDSPSKARFLTPEERVIALHRTLENKTGVMDEDTFKISQMWEALRDPQAWFLALYQFSVNIPNGGVTSFNSIIVNGFGFSPLTTLLVQMPGGGFQLSGLAFIAITTTYVKNSRLPCMIFLVVLSLIGMIMVYTIDDQHRYARLAGLWLAAIFAADIPLSLSLIASNCGGFTKKATVNAMFFVAYCTGNIIGPQFFYTREAPKYPTGIKALLCGFALGVFFLFCLWFYYIYENRRRDKKYGLPTGISETEELEEDISNKTDMELIHFRYLR
ncbi:hypothetical protein EG329_002315 [Mollisiaceae sp. DMI_Dod_QoI]|nr:hypothetical protein EG329_002315 [Helotiales sp. DMI_Dod_QoI]